MTDQPLTSLPHPAPSGQIDAEDAARCLGRQIKALRTRARLTREELGHKIGYGSETVAAVERGRRIPQEQFLAAADSVLDAAGALATATNLVDQIRASTLLRQRGGPLDVTAWHTYAPLLVPDVLQTTDYARAVLTGLCPPLGEEAVEERLTAQAARQNALLDRRPAPLVTCVLEETVLHRPYGGPAALRGQLAHLLDLAQRRHVTLQVLPTAVVEHPGADGPFTLLDPTGTRPAAAVYGGRTTTRREEVRALEQRYGALRAAALTPAASMARIGELLEQSADASLTGPA
ncbi:helix-turn-helix domain-containing protein [Streptomyces megasporus]|uniref:helix-turn-helix domain-containing protein n=1 Tax=Streptomyces megasporus TaxID=44060 RepID=UPI00068AD6F4|nr:helix-turn-helix transcriptional regulator [Streptomyces megasporus]